MWLVICVCPSDTGASYCTPLPQQNFSVRLRAPRLLLSDRTVSLGHVTSQSVASVWLPLQHNSGSGLAQSVYRLTAGFTIWGLKPGGGKEFSVISNVRTGHGTYRLSSGYRYSFQGVKRPENDSCHQPAYSADVKISGALPSVLPLACCEATFTLYQDFRPFSDPHQGGSAVADRPS